MRILSAASIVTNAFLVIALAVGTLQTINNYLTFGPSYTEKIVINGVETTTVITWWASAFTLVIILWVIILNLLLTRAAYRMEKK